MFDVNEHQIDKLGMKEERKLNPREERDVNDSQLDHDLIGCGDVKLISGGNFMILFNMVSGFRTSGLGSLLFYIIMTDKELDHL